MREKNVLITILMIRKARYSSVIVLQKLCENINNETAYLTSLKNKESYTERDILRIFRLLERSSGWFMISPPQTAIILEKKEEGEIIKYWWSVRGEETEVLFVHDQLMTMERDDVVRFTVPPKNFSSLWYHPKCMLSFKPWYISFYGPWFRKIIVHYEQKEMNKKNWIELSKSYEINQDPRVKQLGQNTTHRAKIEALYQYSHDYVGCKVQKIIDGSHMISKIP